MKSGCFLVNTSRGALIHESALITALKSGHVKAAALDVHEREPFDGVSSGFAQLNNVIHTPHAAWFSDESCRELRVSAAREVRRALIGRTPQDLVNCINKDQLLASTGGARRTGATNTRQPTPPALPNVSTFNPLAAMSSFGSAMSEGKWKLVLFNITFYIRLQWFASRWPWVFSLCEPTPDGPKSTNAYESEFCGGSCQLTF